MAGNVLRTADAATPDAEFEDVVAEILYQKDLRHSAEQSTQCRVIPTYDGELDDGERIMLTNMDPSFGHQSSRHYID